MRLWRDEGQQTPPGESDDIDRQVTALFERWRLPIYRYLVVVLGRTGEAEELTQEAFLRLYGYLRAGRSVDEARAWLFSVAHNLAISALRRRRHLVALDHEDAWVVLCDRAIALTRQASNPETGYWRQQRHARLAAGLSDLTAQERSALALRAEGLGYADIAPLLATTYGGAADAVRRAIAKLRRAIDE